MIPSNRKNARTKRRPSAGPGRSERSSSAPPWHVDGGAVSKTLEMEGVFPLPPDRVWNLLWHHMDEDRIRTIHPWILSSTRIREGDSVEYNGLTFPKEKASVRQAKLAGRPSTGTWNYRIEPPDRFGYEILLDNGSTARFDNTYAAAPGGTLVKTRAVISLKGVPDFLAAGAVRRALNRGEREDLAYAKSKKL